MAGARISQSLYCLMETVQVTVIHSDTLTVVLGKTAQLGKFRVFSCCTEKSNDTPTLAVKKERTPAALNAQFLHLQYRITRSLISGQVRATNSR